MEVVNRRLGFEDEFFEGRRKWTKGPYVCGDNCTISEGCGNECNRRTNNKLFVMKIEQGIVRIQKLCADSKLVLGGTEGAASYDIGSSISSNTNTWKSGD